MRVNLSEKLVTVCLPTCRVQVDAQRVRWFPLFRQGLLTVFLYVPCAVRGFGPARVQLETSLAHALPNVALYVRALCT